MQLRNTCASSFTRQELSLHQDQSFGDDKSDDNLWILTTHMPCFCCGFSRTSFCGRHLVSARISNGSDEVERHQIQKWTKGHQKLIVQYDNALGTLLGLVLIRLILSDYTWHCLDMFNNCGRICCFFFMSFLGFNLDKLATSRPIYLWLIC
jgi:hypothetical protein